MPSRTDLSSAPARAPRSNSRAAAAAHIQILQRARQDGASLGAQMDQHRLALTGDDTEGDPLGDGSDESRDRGDGIKLPKPAPARKRSGANRPQHA